MKNLDSIIQKIERINQEMREDFSKRAPKKLWENTHIKHQIDNRKQGIPFSLSDHIRAMVYAMISAEKTWCRIEEGIDMETGRILPLDALFHQYDAAYLLSCTPDSLTEGIRQLKYTSRFTARQMAALLGTNIGKLQRLEKGYGSIDAYYRQFADKDPSLKSLVKTLSNSKSEDKLAQMGTALVSEYLRNAGYDLAKPDRHLKRVLGSGGLGCSEREEVPDNEVFDIVSELADKMGKKKAEVDYILWAYCAKGYGENCRVNLNN